MLAYKYRSGAAFDNKGTNLHLEGLKKNYIWSAETSSLNDPCEGFCNWDKLEEFIKNAEAYTSNLSAYDVAKLFNAIDMLRFGMDGIKARMKSIGIFSLSKTFADEIMWSHYANSHKGFCIEYNLNTLKANRANFLNYFNVSYQNFPPVLEMSDFAGTDPETQVKAYQKIIGTKSKRWDYEEEVRITTETFGRQSHDFRAVTAIYFGLKMEDQLKKEIMEALAGRGVKYFQIYLETGTYQFKAKPIPDSFEGYPKYLYKVAPVEEGALKDALNDYKEMEQYKPYLHYLGKAIEVARRDPYCGKVIYPAFSPSKSTPVNPVLFVNYKTTEGEWQNIFYTLEQLDRLYSEITDLDEPALVAV